MLYFLTFVVVIVLCCAGIVFIFEKGPSESAKNIFVATVTQTSAAKFTAHMFLSEEEVEKYYRRMPLWMQTQSLTEI